MSNIGRASAVVRLLIDRCEDIFSTSPPAPRLLDEAASAEDDDGHSSSAKGDEDSTGSTAASSNAPLSEGAKSSVRKDPRPAEDDESAVERLATPMDEVDEDQIGMAS